ncbi:isoaspartyl peptidase/L-asparaginase isoform X2 [Tupaia chinensis]|uniref:isoaspartyl peptidase/L-asparaginase isoform X2 n=1 Tax=Tupaia chinensis TaxID=246437 RepID=UPI0003C8C585|nr:isoaspartyl peptidase/L-asparaginase isoform X2 [Tupaia chinensis]
MDPVVVVHGGGASNISKDRKERVRQGMVRAATEGYNILKQGGTAVDAVEGAVTVLEDDPEFNAGRGSVLNVNGEVEMDASIMDGKDLSTGAVSAVRCIANPIKLARLVMEKTPHCFLTDQGAAKFAASMGIPEIPGEQLVTERSKKHLEKEKQEKGAQKADCQKCHQIASQTFCNSTSLAAIATFERTREAPTESLHLRGPSFHKHTNSCFVLEHMGTFVTQHRHSTTHNPIVHSSDTTQPPGKGVSTSLAVCLGSKDLPSPAFLGCAPSDIRNGHCFRIWGRFDQRKDLDY